MPFIVYLDQKHPLSKYVKSHRVVVKVATGRLAVCPGCEGDLRVVKPAVGVTALSVEAKPQVRGQAFQHDSSKVWGHNDRRVK